MGKENECNNVRTCSQRREEKKTEKKRVRVMINALR